MRNLVLLILSLSLVTGCGGKAKPNEPASLEDLNRALVVTMMSSGKLPQSVDELTNFPSLKGKQFPAAPAGKKLVIDRNARQVVFADQ